MQLLVHTSPISFPVAPWKGKHFAMNPYPPQFSIILLASHSLIPPHSVVPKNAHWEVQWIALFTFHHWASFVSIVVNQTKLATKTWTPVEVFVCPFSEDFLYWLDFLGKCFFAIPTNKIWTVLCCTTGLHAFHIPDSEGMYLLPYVLVNIFWTIVCAMKAGQPARFVNWFTAFFEGFSVLLGAGYLPSAALGIVTDTIHQINNSTRAQCNGGTIENILNETLNRRHVSDSIRVCTGNQDSSE